MLAKQTVYVPHFLFASSDNDQIFECSTIYNTRLDVSSENVRVLASPSVFMFMFMWTAHTLRTLYRQRIQHRPKNINILSTVVNVMTGDVINKMAIDKNINILCLWKWLTRHIFKQSRKRLRKELTTANVCNRSIKWRKWSSIHQIWMSQQVLL